MKQWPSSPKPEVRVCSLPVSLLDYLTMSPTDPDAIVGIMLGDLQRIKLYAAPHGEYQIPQVRGLVG